MLESCRDTTTSSMDIHSWGHGWRRLGAVEGRVAGHRLPKSWQEWGLPRVAEILLEEGLQARGELHTR